MSENVSGEPEPQSRASFVRGPRDFYGGLVLVGIAVLVFALIAFEHVQALAQSYARAPPIADLSLKAAN